MKLFVDNCLPPRLADALNVLVEPEGHRVVALRHMFPQSTSDVDWISALGADGGWAVLSDDHRIRKVQSERMAWRQANLLGFFLAPGWRKMNTVTKAGHLLLWWPRMVTAAEITAPGSMLEIPAGKGARFRQFSR
ncbi:hypothetical protein [Caenispirillum bisanense]|uniref:PIN-like domain-containing protein n=1 Tax=Caenispirillum bisanense TaxID=414052 RepID=UPI0031D197ED